MSLSFQNVDSRSPFRIQRDVVGALIIRELHTRFGRDNIGYLWVVGEPMMLASVVTAFHVASGVHIDYGIAPASFWIVAYTPYQMLRSVILRAEAALEANRALLYHRMVTLPDMLIARALLEFAANFSAILILDAFAAAVGYGNLPDRPIVLLAGMLLMLWLCFGMSLLVAAVAEVWPVAQRLVHPGVYFLLPICGAFYAMKWISPPFRDFLTWVPLTSCFELIRMGQFQQATDEYVFVQYVVWWCLISTLLGFLALRVVRKGIHLE